VHSESVIRIHRNSARGPNLNTAKTYLSSLHDGDLTTNSVRAGGAFEIHFLTGTFRMTGESRLRLWGIPDGKALVGAERQVQLTPV
jgi:hypothetical protein